MSDYLRTPDEREPGQYPPPTPVKLEAAVNNCRLHKLDAEINATRQTLLRIRMSEQPVNKRRLRHPNQPPAQ